MLIKNSNLTPARTGLVLVLALLIVIAGTDFVLRLVDQRLSGNVAHIQEIPAIVERTGSGAKPSLLVLGNSLTNNGVAAETVARQLTTMQIGKVTPDGSNFWDWQCILDHQVLARDEVKFRAVVIGYAWHLLSDQTQPSASRLGGLFCGWSDLTHPSELGLTTAADIGEFVTARALRMYALRDTLRNRFFQLTIPHYERYTQGANRAAQAGAPAASDQQLYSYIRLQALAAELKAEGTQLIVIAMPVQSEYPIDAGLQALVAQSLLTLYDYRQVEGIDPGSFEDTMHLNHKGQAVLTARLATMLAADVATDSKAAP